MVASHSLTPSPADVRPRGAKHPAVTGKETRRGLVTRARRMTRTLAVAYPEAYCELNFETPFQLVVATVLSAQCTDVRVNQVTPQLFGRFPTAHAMAAARIEEIEEIIRPTGFFRAKASNIHGLSTQLVEKWDGEVPPRLEDLVTLPGVGRKTANVVLGNAFDTPGDKLYIIVEGKLKLSRTAPDGRENLLAILGPSDMFGELSIFDPAPRTSSAICVTDVRTYTMDRAALRRWLDAQPQIAEQLLRVLARRLRRTNNSLADLIFTDVPGRVAKALLQLAQRFGSQEGNTVRVNHDLTQEEIAQLVGASRETVNKALAEFAHRGWIRLEGKSVVICESEHLARRAR